MTQPLVGKDIFEREINIGDWIIYSHSGRGLNMNVCMIIDVNKGGQLVGVSRSWISKIPKPQHSVLKLPPNLIPMEDRNRVHDYVIRQEEFYNGLEENRKQYYKKQIAWIEKYKAVINA